MRASSVADRCRSVRATRCHNRGVTLTKKPETRPAPASWGLAARGKVPWEYAAAPEATDHITIRPEYGLFIDNEFKPSRPRATFTVINPATEEPLAKVAKASRADVNRAVTAARRAYEHSLVAAARQRAGEVPLPHRADHAGAQPRVRRGRDHELRQADQGDRATSTCRSRPRTSSTTPAGRTSSTTPSRVASRGRWAWRPRSFRGTSRC